MIVSQCFLAFAVTAWSVSARFALPPLRRPRLCRSSGSTDTLEITAAGEKTSIKMQDVLADKCQICAYPDPLISDVLIGEKHADRANDVSPACQGAFEAKPAAEKLAFGRIP